MNYEEFEEMMMKYVLEDIKWHEKRWLFDLDFMEKWKPSEIPAKDDKNEDMSR